MKAVHEMTARGFSPSAASFEPSPSEDLMHMGWECRRLAGRLSDPDARRHMIMLADCFERLARVREGNREERSVPQYAND